MKVDSQAPAQWVDQGGEYHAVGVGDRGGGGGGRFILRLGSIRSVKLRHPASKDPYSVLNPPEWISPVR